jgi:hypothetical protein
MICSATTFVIADATDTPATTAASNVQVWKVEELNVKSKPRLGLVVRVESGNKSFKLTLHSVFVMMIVSIIRCHSR